MLAGDEEHFTSQSNSEHKHPVPFPDLISNSTQVVIRKNKVQHRQRQGPMRSGCRTAEVRVQIA